MLLFISVWKKNEFVYSLNQFCWSYACLAVLTRKGTWFFFVVFKNTTIHITVFTKIIILTASMIQSYHRNGKQIELSHKTFKFCVIDQSVFMIFLINKMTQQSRGHTKLYIFEKSLFSLKVLISILSYFLKKKKKKSTGSKHNTILQNPKGCISNIRQRHVGLGPGEKLFLFLWPSHLSHALQSF